MVYGNQFLNEGKITDKLKSVTKAFYNKLKDKIEEKLKNTIRLTNEMINQANEQNINENLKDSNYTLAMVYINNDMFNKIQKILNGNEKELESLQSNLKPNDLYELKEVDLKSLSDITKYNNELYTLEVECKKTIEKLGSAGMHIDTVNNKDNEHKIFSIGNVLGHLISNINMSMGHIHKVFKAVDK